MWQGCLQQNVTKCCKYQGYSFYRSLVIKGKPTEGGGTVGGGVKIPPTHPPWLELMKNQINFYMIK